MIKCEHRAESDAVYSDYVDNGKYYILCQKCKLYIELMPKEDKE